MSSLHLFSPSWLALLYPDIDGRLRLLMFLSTKIRRNRLEINDNRRKICKPPVLAYHKFGSMGSIIFSTAFVIAIKAGFRWPVMATPRSRRYSFNPAMDMSLKFLDPEALNILFLIHGRFTSEGSTCQKIAYSCLYLSWRRYRILPFETVRTRLFVRNFVLGVTWYPLRTECEKGQLERKFGSFTPATFLFIYLFIFRISYNMGG